MKRKYIFLASFLAFVFSTHAAHDIRMAIFSIHASESGLLCDVRLDHDDIKKAVGSVLLDNLLSDYFEKHFQLRFDDEAIVLEFEKFEVQKEWITVSFRVKSENEKPKKVEVKNSVLLNEIDGHQNIVRFDLHEKLRSFRLSQDKPTTTFAYKN